MMFIKEKLFTEKRFVNQQHQVPEAHAESQPKGPGETAKFGTSVNNADIEAAGNEAIKDGEKKIASAEVMLEQMATLSGQPNRSTELSSGTPEPTKEEREKSEQVRGEIYNLASNYIETKSKSGSHELENPGLFAENLTKEISKIDRKNLVIPFSGSFNYTVGKEVYTYSYQISRAQVKITPPIH